GKPAHVGWRDAVEAFGKIGKLGGIELVPAVRSLEGPNKVGAAVPHQAEAHGWKYVPTKGRSGGHRLAVAKAARGDGPASRPVGALRQARFRDETVEREQRGIGFGRFFHIPPLREAGLRPASPFPRAEPNRPRRSRSRRR